MARKKTDASCPGRSNCPCSRWIGRSSAIHTKSRATTGSTTRRPERQAAPEYGAPASYWYKTERTGSAQLSSGLAEEERDDLPLVNALREDVRKWREPITRARPTSRATCFATGRRADRARRLFFCQVEAVETIIYLLEIRFPGKVGIRGNPKLR